jgi:integrase
MSVRFGLHPGAPGPARWRSWCRCLAGTRTRDLPARPDGQDGHRTICAHLREEDYDIRTVQERIGHREVSATMIYTHVLNRGPAGVRSPADRMFLDDIEDRDSPTGGGRRR